MTTTPLEHLLTAALHHHAEDAMNDTDTEARLHDLFQENEKRVQRRRTAWTAGAVAAAVAIVAALAWWPGLGDPDAVPDPVEPVPELTSAEQFATDFFTSWATFDRDLMASYLAENPQLSFEGAYDEAEWMRFNQFVEATDFRDYLERCYETQVIQPDGAQVGCLFSYDGFGSQELGRGPYPDNVLNITIRDGKVTHAGFSLSQATGGFDDEMAKPLDAWFDETYPEDETLDDWEDPKASAAEVDQSLELWSRLVEEYVAAVKAGEAE